MASDKSVVPATRSVAEKIAWHNREATLTTNPDTANWHWAQARLLAEDSAAPRIMRTDIEDSKHLENEFCKKQGCIPVDSAALPSPQPLEELAEWLFDEADKRMKQAASRREDSMDRNATAAELKRTKAAAEKMFGRKLDLVSTNPKDHRAYCDMQSGIAGKLESEAKQLSDWAGWVLAAQLALNTEHVALVAALKRECGRKAKGETS